MLKACRSGKNFAAAESDLGKRRSARAVVVRDGDDQDRRRNGGNGYGMRRRRHISHGRPGDGAQRRTATTAEARPGAAASMIQRRGMAGGKAGANRQDVDFACPGTYGTADGEQYRLQRQRIRRRQRHQSACMMPHIHRLKSKGIGVVLEWQNATGPFRMVRPAPQFRA